MYKDNNCYFWWDDWSEDVKKKKYVRLQAKKLMTNKVKYTYYCMTKCTSLFDSLLLFEYICDCPNKTNHLYVICGQKTNKHSSSTMHIFISHFMKILSKLLFSLLATEGRV